MSKKPTVLMILDGYGLNAKNEATENKATKDTTTTSKQDKKALLNTLLEMILKLLSEEE